MVLCKQETVDALQYWIRNFSIRQIDGENVSAACTQCKGVIRALDGIGLSNNVLQCLLDGFAQASNESFKALCVSLSTTLHSTILQNGSANMSTKQKCFAVLKDLKTLFIELSTSRKWGGAGHDGATFRASLNDKMMIMAA